MFSVNYGNAKITRVIWDLTKKKITTLVYFLFLSDIYGQILLPLSQVAMTISLETTENKQGFEWQVDALRSQRGRGWQAAVTVVLLPHKLLLLVKLQASPGWSLLHVLLLSPSIRPFIDLSILLFLSDFFFFFPSLPFLFYASPIFSFTLILSSVSLHLQSFTNFLSSFIFSFIERLETYK